MKYGILLQGKVTNWTADIVNEYNQNFPDAEILLSTWSEEDVSKIQCKSIRLDPPTTMGLHKSTVNYQIVGTKEGLKNIDAEIILKCRTDQFIHNSKIFSIFENLCCTEKIMVPDQGTFESYMEYRTSDFCQVATKKTLSDFWLDLPLYDGNEFFDAGVYLTKNYIQNVKNDKDPWLITLKKYFCVKSFEKDFQIEWEKLNNLIKYQKQYSDVFEKKVNYELY